MFWPAVFHPVRSIISTIIPMNLTLEVVLELWSDSSRVIHQPGDKMDTREVSI